MEKIVFFDVDGTLLPGGAGKIPADTEQALFALREKGIGVVLCSGRHPNEVKDFLYLPFDGFVHLNGQLCLDAEGRTLFANPIVGADKALLLERFEEKQLPMILVERGRQFMNCHSPQVKLVQDECALEIYPIEPYRGADILMATIFTDQELTFGALEVGRWHAWACDVYHTGAGKRKGLEVFMREFGVARANTLAFGDALNDVEMLKFAGLGIAMGNGYAEAKRAADYVTDAADRGGIHKALVHFGLI